MKVRDVMTSPVITVAPGASFSEIVDTLLTHEISGVPVVDGDQRLLGLVTEADIVSKAAYGYRRRRALGLVADYLRGHDPQWVRKAAGTKAADIMTAPTAVVDGDDDIAVAARRLVELHHKRLPVLEAGRLVGIVSRHDLLRPFRRTDGEILDDVTALLADARRVPETHDIQPDVAAGVVVLAGTVEWPSDRVLFESVIARVPGVVAIDNRLLARLPEPRLSGALIPPLH